jgi:hypothetical protein
MSEEQRKILEMLVSGKITIDDAERLLGALSSGQGTDEKGKFKVKYLRVVVEPDPGDKKGERVNIRVPLKLIRAGLKLASVIPKDAQRKVNEALNEKGINLDFSQIRAEDLDVLVEQLDDITVDVEGKEKVRVFCE